MTQRGGKSQRRKKEKRHTRTDFERKHGELVAAVPQGPNFLLRVVGPAFAAASIIALFIVAEKMIHGRVWIFGLVVNLSSQLLLLFFYLLEIIFSKRTLRARALY